MGNISSANLKMTIKIEMRGKKGSGLNICETDEKVVQNQ